jgi:hypothetical protein
MTTETKLTQPAVINPRNTGMKWQKLGEAKDPEFDKLLFLYDPEQIEYPYTSGYLVSIESTAEGKVYTFEMDGYTETGALVTSKTVTHFAIPKPPVD